MPSVGLQIKDDQVTPQPVSDVFVEVYNAGGAFVTSGSSDSLGELMFTLPNADYDLLFFKQGVSVLPRQPQRITVDSPAVFLVTVHVRTLPESIDPLLCRVSGSLFGPDGKPSQSAIFAVALDYEVTVIGEDGNVVIPASNMLVRPDEPGQPVEFDLIRKQRYKGYFVHLESVLGRKPPEHVIIVPDLPAIRLDKLLYPVPEIVTFSDGAIVISKAAGSDSSVTVSTIYTDGSTRTEAVPWGRTTLVVDDPDILSAVLTKEGTLIINPLGIGDATITFERKIEEHISFDPLPSFSSGTLMVTVTA